MHLSKSSRKSPALSPMAQAVSACLSGGYGRALVTAALLAPAMAGAGPQNGQVVAGKATIQTQGSATTITQSTQRAIIDWKSFNVGSGERVKFVQPDARSATLNRITGGDPSHIFGRVSANGQLYLINASGIVFGEGSRLDVGALVASTADIENSDFLAGRLVFGRPGRAGARIENRGAIHIAEGGMAALVGHQVANHGVIEARLGKVTLAAGEAFTLDLAGDQLVNLVVDRDAMNRLTDAAGQPLASLVDHSGRILAEGGRVQLAASTVNEVLNGLVNVSGLIRATSYDTSRPGVISLRGDAHTDVRIIGTLDVSGRQGGRLEVTGDHVALGQGARLSANGLSNGGSVALGGDWQGQGPLAHSGTLSVAQGASISANGDNGVGGTIVLWSREATRFEGTAQARGGNQGGRIEVSSLGSLGFLGEVDLTARRGAAGQLLLDPKDLTIGTVSSGDSQVAASVIRSILMTGTDVTLTASQDITVASAINSLGGTSGGGLTLTAGDDLMIKAPISLQDGALTLTAQSGQLSTGGGITLYTGSGDMRLSGGAGVRLGQLLSTGDVVLGSANGSVTVSEAILGASSQSTPGAVGSLDVSAAGSISLAGAFAEGDVNLNSRSGNIVLSEAVVWSTSGSVAVSAAGQVQGSATGAGLVAADDVSVTAGGPVQLDLLLADGRIDVSTSGAATASVTVNQAISGASEGGAPTALSIASAGGITLHGAEAGSGGIELTASQGNVRSIDEGLVSTGRVSVHAEAGSIGSASQRLSASAGRGSAGGIELSAGESLYAASLITQGSVELTSGGRTDVSGVMAGAAGTSPSAVPGVATLAISAGGPVSLAGAWVGAGGAEITGSGVTIGSSGIAVKGTGGDIAITSTGAGQSVQLNGDLSTQAGDISLTSDGDVIARVQAAGGDPVVGDTALVAGTAASLSDVSITAGGDIQLGEVQAQGTVSLTSTDGNVALLKRLGGDATGYTTYALGYQAGARPNVGRLVIEAPKGWVELNGLNLDGNADPYATADGLAIQAGTFILSNDVIAVNKGDITLASGDTRDTDGIYLGASLYSRGWDHVGTNGRDAANAPAGTADDVRLGYNISLSGGNLGLFDNSDGVATLSGMYSVGVKDLTTGVVSQVLAMPGQLGTVPVMYVVDKNGKRIKEDGQDLIVVGRNGYVVQIPATDRGSQDLAVIGTSISRTLAKIEIANNAANYADGTDSDPTLVPVTTDSMPMVDLSFSGYIGGVRNMDPSASRQAGGSGSPVNWSASTFAPQMLALSDSPISVASDSPDDLLSDKGLVLKVLGFAGVSDSSTQVWQTGSLARFDSVLFSNCSGSTNCRIQGFVTSEPDANGYFTVSMKGYFEKDGEFCDCDALYTLRRINPLSNSVEVTGISVKVGGVWTTGWTPAQEVSVGIGSQSTIRFMSDIKILDVGVSTGVRIAGELKSSDYASGDSFSGPVTQSDGAYGTQLGTSIFRQVYEQRTPDRAADGTYAASSSNISITYAQGGVSVSTSADGVYTAATGAGNLSGTRVVLFDGVIQSGDGVSFTDQGGAAAAVSTKTASLGPNSTITAFSSVGALNSGLTDDVFTSGSVANAPASALPPLADDSASGLQPDVSVSAERVNAAAEATSGDPAAGEAAAGQASFAGPAQVADLGQSGGVPSVQADVFALQYPLLKQAPAGVCAGQGARNPARSIVAKAVVCNASK